MEFDVATFKVATGYRRPLPHELCLDGNQKLEARGSSFPFMALYLQTHTLATRPPSVIDIGWPSHMDSWAAFWGVPLSLDRGLQGLIRNHRNFEFRQMFVPWGVTRPHYVKQNIRTGQLLRFCRAGQLILKCSFFICLNVRMSHITKNL